MPDRKLILLLGGGDGIPRGIRILKRLLAAGLDAQFAVVCGRNARLLAKAQTLQRQYPHCRLQVFGFVDCIPELIGISDLVITKCGASTFMEILFARKIPVINSYIWEQEKGNLEYVTGNRMGIYERRVRHLPSVVTRLMTDNIFYNAFQDNIEQAALRNGTPHVAGFIMATAV